MPRRQALADRIKERIERNRRATAFVRKDFKHLGDYDQVGRALRELVDRGVLARVGYGIYAKARPSRLTGKPVLRRPLIAVAVEGLRKIGYTVLPGVAAQANRDGRSTQMPVRQRLIVQKKRVSRVIAFGRDKISYE